MDFARGPAVTLLALRATMSSGGEERTKPFGGFPHHCKRLFENSLLSHVTPHVLRHRLAAEIVCRESFFASWKFA
jgi:hypothetical protein